MAFKSSVDRARPGEDGNGGLPISMLPRVRLTWYSFARSREPAWAPPYAAEELRDAHLAEDTCRTGAILAWHQADAARDWAQGSLARQQALALISRAQKAGALRQALGQIAEARAAWHHATEPTRQRALAAETELRRRHPGIDLPPFHSEQEHGARTQHNVGRESSAGKVRT